MSRKETMALQRMRLILTNEQMERLCFKDEPGSELTLCLDLHGLTCKEARRLVDMVIFLVRDNFLLLLVHGYQHGQSIKDMLWYQYDNHRLQSRRDDDYNLGLTYFNVA